MPEPTPTPVEPASTQSPSDASGDTRVGARLGAGLLALAIAFAVCATTDATAALARPLWLDEVVTQLIASAPDGVIHAMRSGADFQPPPYYSLVRFADVVTGTSSAAMARMPSLLAAMVTVFLVATTLRARLSLPAALSGALILAAHPLFVAQAIEARPYALWILATALTAEALRDRKRWRPWLMAIAAIALCTVHYFGIIALAVIGGTFIAYRRFVSRDSWVSSIRSALPLAAGALALAALLPLARAQLAATAGESWASQPTPADNVAFLRFIWGWRPVLYLLGCAAAFAFARRIPSLTSPLRSPGRATLDAPVFAMLATAAVPLLVVAVSVAYKPLSALRYSAPALLAAAAICAVAVNSCPRWVRWACAVFMVRAMLLTDQSLARATGQQLAAHVAEQGVLADLARKGVPAASYSRHDAYAASFARDVDVHVTWFDASDGEYERAVKAAPELTMPALRVERGFGVAVRNQFRFPDVLTLADLRAKPAVALLRDPDTATADTVWLPGRTACVITPRIVVYSQAGAAPACESLRAR